MKRSKKWSGFCWLLTGSILLSACQANPSSTGESTQPQGTQVTQPVTDAPVTTGTETEPMKLGNTNQNYMNMGMYAEDDEWVWFSDREDSYRLSRMKPDGTGKENFAATTVAGKNIVDGMIYYLQAVGESGAGQIWKMNLSGTDPVHVSEIQATLGGAFLTLNSEIYFSNFDDNSRVYRMKLDGSEPQKLSDNEIWTLNADQGWLFCLVVRTESDSQVMEVHKMRPDGSEDSVLVKVGQPSFLADQGWVYFKNEGGLLYRIKYDGSGKEAVVESPVNSFTLDSGKLYYTDQNSNELMMVKLGENDPKKLAENTSMVQLAGDWLYLFEQTGRVYRMKPEGGDIEKAYSLTMVQPDPDGAPVIKGLGVTNSNIKGGAIFTGEDDLLYYTKFGESILKMKADGSERSMILDHWVNSLNRVGDWLYFIDREAYGSIARCRIDGTGYGVIYDGNVDELIVKDNWIYFADSQNNLLGKIRTDGTRLKSLSDTKAMNLNLDGDWLYWTKASENSWSGSGDGIYRKKTEGGKAEKLYEGPVGAFIAGEGYVYFSKSDEYGTAGALMRMKLDGKDAKTIVETNAITMAGVYKDWIYYYDGNEEAGLFRAKLDGSQQKRLVGPGNYVWVHFLGDRIIYYDNGEEKFRLMDLDGTNIRDFAAPIDK